MSEKTFLLGVGAQKSGTTWLARHLDWHPATDMGFTKEYHIFDVTYIKDAEIQEKYLRARLARYMQLPAGRKPFGKVKNSVKRVLSRFGYIYPDHLALSFIADTELYFDYFDGLINLEGGVSLTGDICPSYSGLPKEAFSAIKNGFEARGVRVKVVFIMRDPVDRCISAVRHRLRNRSKPFELDEEIKALLESYQSSGFMFRTKYENTINEIESVFGTDDVYYAFFEEFFSDAALRSASDFLGIEFTPGRYSVRENASNADREIPEDIRREIFNFYADTYRAIAKKFGAERLSGVWDSYAMFG